MSNKKYSEDVSVTRDYYNSQDAHNFYYRIWGGEHLHLGIYKSPDGDVVEASERTVDHMASYADKLDSNTKIIDLGGGFSGVARHLAKKYGCHVTVLNLSETENDRGRKMNKEQGIDHLIDVVDGSFDTIPFEDESYDIVWSEDAILHSSDRGKVMEEAYRVLKPGGNLIFSDPMQTDNCDTSILQPVYYRIKLTSFGSPSFYQNKLEELGMEKIAFEELTDHLIIHYSRILEETEKNKDKL